MVTTIVISLIILSAAAALALAAYLPFLRRRLLFDSLRQTLLSVRLPRRRPAANQPADSFKDEINESTQLYALLGSFKRPFTLEAAVPHIGEEIRFFVAVSRDVAAPAIRQIHALWPEAEIKETSEFNIFNPTGAVAAASLRLRYSDALPIRTFQEVGDDTFAPVLSGLSKINEIGEGALVQIVVRPAGKKASKSVYSKIDAARKGGKTAELIRRPVITAGDFLKAVTPINPPRTPTSDVGAPPADTELIRALEFKLSKPLFEVNVRIIASAPSRLQADSILDGITAGFSQLESPNRNRLDVARPRHLRAFTYNASFRLFSQKNSLLLNSEELASIFHFPTVSAAVPRVAWLRAREAAPPEKLPSSGVLIGETSFRGERHPVFISDDDRRRHTYLIGQTGTGKSTLMTNMVLSDVRRGLGVCIIDPHGDLVETIAGLIPDERRDDVIIMNPGNLHRPLALNMLDVDPDRPEEKTFVVNEMQSIFNRLFPPETMGPMFEQYMRNALLLLMEDAPNEPASLVEVPRVFTDADWRAKKLARIHNPSVIDFWEKEATKAGGEASLANMTPYITSKFNNFIANDYLRPIIGQLKSSFRFRDVMDNRKILLVNLAKGRIGDINAGLLGMVITSRLLLAALSRTDIPQDKRVDFNLYIDEFQNFTTDSIATILSEARKYRLNLVMAHQFIAQLTDQIRNAVFGNVGSIISFRIGASDAEALLKQFAPVFSEDDLINLENYRAYAKLLINGEPSTPFNIVTFPSDQGNPARAAAINEYVSSRFGRPRPEVEDDILRRLRS